MLCLSDTHLREMQAVLIDIQNISLNWTERTWLCYSRHLLGNTSRRSITS